MGSITKSERTDKTGKTVKVFRAYVRREGFASKSKVFKTEREAKEWLRNSDADSALQKAGSRKTLSKLIEDFTQSPPTPGTKFWSLQHLDFWIEQLGTMPVTSIDRGDINSAVATLRTRKARRHTPAGVIETDKPLSPATVNRYLASLSSVLNFALERNIIDAHPMKGGKVKKLTEGPGRRRILTAEEEARLMDAARTSEWPMLYLFVRMCLTTAARKSEVLNLRWPEVRFEESVAILHTSKNGRARALPLVGDVREALREAAKVKPLHSEFVFFDPKEPSQPKKIDVVWRKCRADAGLLKDREDELDRVYLHSTRHTAVTRMLRGGASTAQAAAVSGHQTLAMLKRYEHLAAADSVELAERLLSGK
jgi:integrase